MLLLDRYFGAQFVKNFLIAAFALVAFYLFQSLIGELFSHEYTREQVLYYHFLGIPQVFVQLAPPAILLSTVLTLAGLARTQELVACFSVGYGLRRIATVFLSLTLVCSVLVLFMQDRVLPRVYKKRMTFYWHEMKKRPDFFLDIKLDKVWYRSQNLIYNLRRFDASTNTIYGMAVFVFDSRFNLLKLIEAERAEYQPEGNSGAVAAPENLARGHWKLKNGTVTVYATEDPFPESYRFRERELKEGQNVVIRETPREFKEIDKEVDSLKLQELSDYIDRSKTAGANTQSFEVKFHSKLSTALIPLVMCLLGIPFSMRGKREGGVAKELGACLVLTFFYWLFYSVGLSLGSNGALKPWIAAWLPTLAFGGLAIGLLVSRRR
jgi:lipopolysaccharide export system permease protein